MLTRFLCVIACLFTFASSFSSAEATSPYAGQETRDIKALAPEDVAAYLSGSGMGLAKAAELNGYPGPAHVLAMADDLQLTPDQKQRTERLFKDMEVKASSLGRALIAQERRLDEQFASKTITQGSLAAMLRRIGELQAEVRGAHLEAHLAQWAILTPAQVAKYQAVRGYQNPSHEQTHQHMH